MLLNRRAVRRRKFTTEAKAGNRMETIQTKISISAELASAFMRSIKQNCADLFQDGKFCCLFNALQNYIDDGCALPDADAIDYYVIYEQIK